MRRRHPSDDGAFARKAVMTDLVEDCISDAFSWVSSSSLDIIIMFHCIRVSIGIDYGAF